MSRKSSTWTKPLTQINAKKFFTIICLLSTLSLTWMQFNTKRPENLKMELLIQEAIDNVGEDLRYTNVYKKDLPNDYKYILLWTRNDFQPFPYLGIGQRTFLKHNCPINNCYVTDKRNLLGDVTKFDAVIFNARNLKYISFPERSLHQKYILVSTESPENHPICDAKYDDFFNWTYTYRLDSDIEFPYIVIKDKNGTVIGPKEKMNWEDPEKNKAGLIDMTRNKTKAVAWFVSNCSTRSRREQYVNNLLEALKDYGLLIDIYGKCGTHTCVFQSSECDEVLRRDYFFYLAMENSFSVDYVSEKLLTALRNDLVPIVFGGANYSRFLPPGSYINARYITERKLASLINSLIQSPIAYSRYFWWKKYYTYETPTQAACNLCAALNDEEKMKISTYPHFREWWNGDGMLRCSSWT